MNEQDFKNRIEQRWNRERWAEHQHKGRRWVGVFLLIIGGLLLAKASGVLFPAWFFTWPMILIGVGLFSGIRHGFRGFGWIIPIIIGVVFLADEITPDRTLKPYIWPIAIIAAGLLFILRPKKKRWLHDDAGFTTANPLNEQDRLSPETNYPQDQTSPDAHWQKVVNDSNDVIDATAIFGGVKRHVLSKNFKGGDVTTFMGGAEINLTQADCNGKVVIDCFNMFGGTKLIVPADWDVQSEVVTIFGGIEDKRQPTQANPNKILYLDGTCIFGGVEIKSF